MSSTNREDIITEMRANLLSRNGNNNDYTLKYTMPGRTYNINNCSDEELLAIDGDMCPLGM